MRAVRSGFKVFAFIRLLPLIQEGVLSVTSESMCIEYWLACPGKNVYHPDIPIVEDWEVKLPIKQIKKYLPHQKIF